MLLAFLIVGIIMTSSAVKGTEHELGDLVAGDFTNAPGSPSFLYWGGSVMGIGAIGFIPGLARLSNYLLALLFVVIILSDRGVFANFVKAVQDVAQVGPAPDVAAPASSASGGGSSSDGSVLGTLGSLASTGLNAATGGLAGIIGSIF